MSVLVLDYGGSNITVQCQKGGHAAPRRVGAKPIGFAGGETSSVRAELMVVPVVLQYLSPSDLAAIRTLFALGAQVPCRGDVFNNASATIVCSGVLSDEFLPSGPWFEGSLTLYEIGTGLGFSGGTQTPVYLGNGASPVGGPGVLGASPDQADIDPDGWAFYSMFPLDSPPTCPGAPDVNVDCPVLYSTSPEKTWLTEALAATTLSGTPTVVMAMNGGTGSVWATQAVYVKVYVVRSGVDVFSFQTGWSASNGGFAGADVTMTSTSSILYALLDGDQLRFEVWARMGVHQGYSDDGVHQRIGVGHLGGATYLTTAYLGGTIQKLLP